MSHTTSLLAAASVVALLSACKVQTETETVPEAEGNGKRALNIRVEPMNREEMKDAAGKVIDGTAQAAGEVKDAATSLAADTRNLTRDAGTAINNALPSSTPVTTPSAEVIATPAPAVTE